MTLHFKNQAAYDKWAASLPQASRLRLATLDGAPVATPLAAPAPVLRAPAPAKRRRRWWCRPARVAVRWACYAVLCALPAGPLVLAGYLLWRRS